MTPADKLLAAGPRSGPSATVLAGQLGASRRLTVGIEYGRSPTECEALLGRVIALGFADLNAKASTLTMFCGHFSFQDGDEAMLRRYLDPLVVGAQDRVRTYGRGGLGNYLESCHRIYERLDARSRDR